MLIIVLLKCGSNWPDIYINIYCFFSFTLYEYLEFVDLEFAGYKTPTINQNFLKCFSSYLLKLSYGYFLMSAK